jgi:AAA+ ATPase superfamily predicted ATPase
VVFIARKDQMRILSEERAQITANSGRFVWMLGRRRVGKSRLVEEFLSEQMPNHVFFQAPRRGRQDALDRFVDTVAHSAAPAAATAAGASFSSWPAALAFAAQGATESAPVAIVIDELPYLVDQDPGFASDLQQAWDHALRTSPVLLIAIGSDQRMMRALTTYAAELHDRPTRELPVPPFNPAEVADLVDAKDAAEALDTYLVVGGYPSLAASWPKGASRRRFLSRGLRDSSTPFVVNAMRIMDAEFTTEIQARQVLEGIGHGETTFTNIARRSGITNSRSLTLALEVLVESKRLVQAELPFAAPPGKKNKRYTVIDPYLRFWLRFVGPNLDEIDRGRSDLVLERIERGWSSYRGRAIEPVVRAALERMLADPGFGVAVGGARYVGGYWTRDNQIEVDLTGARDANPSAIAFIGSVKWREPRLFTASDAGELAARRADVPGAAAAKLLGVARDAFHPDAELDARVTAADLLRAWR